MKKINFDDLMSSVSEQFIDEAASFTPIKVFNTRFVALVACIAIIVTAIPAVVILNREKDVDAPKVTTPVENIVVTPGGEEEENKSLNVIYCDSLMMKKEGLIQNAFNDKNVEIKNTNEFLGYRQRYNSPGTKVEPDIFVPEELNFTFGEISLIAKLDSVYYTKRSEQIPNDTLKENNKIAKYLIENINGETTDLFTGYGHIYYSVAAQEVLGLTTYTLPMYSEEKLTEEELMEIVKKDVSSLYGEDFLFKYSVRVAHYYKNPTALDPGGWKYNVDFDRKIDSLDEFGVDESLSLNYTGSGQLYMISSTNLNSFNSVESKLKEESLKEVEEKAIKLLDGRLVEDKELVINVDGDVYVYYGYLKREGDENYPLSMYGHFRIKVNLD